MVQVPSGVISVLSHPPYGLLSRETGSVLTSGVTQIQRIRGPVTVDAFGLSFSFVTIPAAFGWTQRIQKDYETPIVILAPLYESFDGHDMHGPAVELTHDGDVIYFDQLLPKRIDVSVQVGCSVLFYWLVAL